MSIKAFRWAKAIKGLKPPQKAVLMALADFFNDEKRCAWPSQSTLADYTGYDRSTVHRAVKVLLEKGYVSQRKRNRVGGHFPHNEYRLHHVAESHMVDSHLAEKEVALLQSETPPCGTLQRKHLGENLDKTLNISKASMKSDERNLSEKQQILAEGLANRYWEAYKAESFPYEYLLKEVQDFLRTPQTEEDWIKLGNGLPSPRQKGWLK